MDVQPASQPNLGRKRMIRILFGLFIGLLLLFTLLSRTLLALTLPKVAVAELSPGQLIHTFQGSSVLKWKAEASLTNSTGWKVKKVNVKEGDPVKKGQTLVTYDKKEAEQQILDEQASLDKLKLTIKEQQGLYIEASQSGDQKNIDSARLALEMSKIDLGVQQRKIEKLEDNLAVNAVIAAPFDGIVTIVNATEGLLSSNGEPDVRISNSSLGFEFELAAPAAIVDRLQIGEKIDVQITGTTMQQTEGQIADIREATNLDNGTAFDSGGSSSMNTPMKRLLITLHEAGLKGGEHVQVDLTKSTTEETLLVPNTAIHKDSRGAYIYKVEEHDGPLGNTFYVRRASITITDSNDQVSAVTEGVFEHDLVILENSQPLQDGDKVRM